MKRVLLTSLCVLFISSIVSADTFDSADGLSQFDIDFVTISGDNGDLGSWAAGHRYTFSGVNRSDYRMAKYEITNDQYAKFASNNPHFGGADIPANMVTWFEAAQFVNYLNTSTGNQRAYKFTANVVSVWQEGEDGYDASNPYRNSNAKYFIPTQDEWVKAAYWNGTSLQTYATKASESLAQGDGTSGTGWNYYYNDRYATDPSGPWNVGNGSEELNGTHDMMGNILEWTESLYPIGQSDRFLRGGSYHRYGYYGLSSQNTGYTSPSYEGYDIGFRVASVVPEPCSLVLLSIGGLMLRRKRKA